MTAQSLLLLIAFFAAVCVWQIWAGYRKMSLARANPDAPMAAAYARAGKLQAGLGAAMLLANILFNWQTVRAVLS